MPDSITKIIGDFKTQRWQSKPFERVVQFLDEHPDDCGDLVRSVINELQLGPTFFHYAIDCLPEAAIPELVPVAIAAFGKNVKNEAAADFIAHTSLQSPKSLHPHLDRIFSLQPNWSTYYALWPWRGSGNFHLSFLKEVVARKAGSIEIRKFPGGRRNPAEAALSAMLETRQREAFNFVWRVRGDEAIHHLLQVGFDGAQQDFQKLYTDTVLHLCFPSGYFRDENTRVHQKKRNPTWRLSTPSSLSATFGGNGGNECQICGGFLHNLITLSPIPPNIGVSEMPSLSLQTCLSCLGYEEHAATLFYEHDVSGAPRSLNLLNVKATPKFPATSLLRCDVTVCPTPQRWFWQDWALSNSRENLNRLGGHPAWIQNADYLTCPKCNRRMRHLLQLDSELPTSDGRQWLWGSGGCCYVEWCDTCKVSGFQWQCT